MITTIAQTTSHIPILALFAEGMALIVYLFLSLRLGTKWRERRSKATFNLFLSFLSYFVAIIFLFSTKSTDYFTGDLYNVSTIGINIGYSFSLLGNVFLFYFTENIFFEEPRPYLREAITLGNGVTLGFLMISIFQIQSFPFLEIPGEYIPAHLLIWHVIVSSIGFLILFIKSLQAVFQAEARLQRAGFLMITITAIFELMVFIFFFADRFLGGGYTTWYFLAWLSASLGGLFAMVGYLMPNWFRRIFES
ncbi:MAG: hypothetical protein ACFFAJ_17775 [Candidatus Hodarchaeota archaeon]